MNTEVKRQKVKVKKSQITVIEHTKEWFLNRVGKQIFYRLNVVDRVTGISKFYRKYIMVESPAHAEALYVHQNVSGKRYFQ